ncbi:hypothetical protein [Helicobacter pylori]|uniref:hypothetical protein n=1 Tax=Helicobacter pylori TaxID=210 RepID=UPI0012E90B41|nr:hypothetical protein [Helicobacter pylori]MUU23404.1 hypothetical protein [Helicobacter pylori]MUU38000.1 hypothetical protein [Helicobacter pylori]MUU81242.1 hypothetical protein [Helicobacter pylori]MUU89167.1 hypothetical protein [Helicobacter pylori]WQU00868.1 hypothetical protein KVD03_04550 [Helicobacter pylori]
MPNTTKKDYTKYSQRQLFNLINQLEQKISQAFDDKRGCCLGRKIPDIQTQQAMRDAVNGENLEVIEDFSAWANEIKKEVNAEN